MANIKIVNNHKELNSLGCEFFTKANESHITRISSAKLRWLSIRTEKGEYISPMQETACSFIENVADNYGAKAWDKFNLKILLYENPIKYQDKYIKSLLTCGADIRYLNEKDCSKIVIQDNYLYLTFASSFEKVVNTGFLYTGNIDDPYIDLYTQQFDMKFSKAKKMALKDGRIVYANNFLTRIKDEIKDLGLRDWIILLLGTLFGGAISIIACLLI